MMVVAADDDVGPSALQTALARQQSQMQHAAHASTADELRAQLQAQQEAMAAMQSQMKQMAALLTAKQQQEQEQAASLLAGAAPTKKGFARVTQRVMAAMLRDNQSASADCNGQGQFDAFLSHNWGLDTAGRNNHKRVGALNGALRAAGVSTWFDGAAMEGDIAQCMAAGIDASSVFVIFITKEYIRKCAERGTEDNCHAEFAYAVQRKGVGRIVAVVAEPELLDTRLWRGPVGLRLNGLLYIDMSKDGGEEAAGLELAAAVRDAAARPSAL